MLAALIMIANGLRTIPRFKELPAVPWQLSLATVVSLGGVVLLCRLWGHPDPSDAHRVANVTAQEIAQGLGEFEPRKAPATSMTDAIAALERRLASRGGSDADWELLAKSYEFVDRPSDAASARSHHLPSGEVGATTVVAKEPMALTSETQKRLAEAERARRGNRLKEAAAIYKALSAAGPMSAEAWANYADIVASLPGGKLQGEAEALIDKALAQDPEQPKALWLKASAYEEAGRYAEAGPLWQRLKLAIPSDSEDGKVIANKLAQDAALEPTQRANVAPAPSGGEINGEISIAPALVGKATPGTIFYVVARSLDSPGPPVAVIRGVVREWPVSFTLSDGQSMVAGRNLTSAGRVTVEARISLSGAAMPASGDLRGKSGVIDASSHQRLKILIDEVVG